MEFNCLKKGKRNNKVLLLLLGFFLIIILLVAVFAKKAPSDPTDESEISDLILPIIGDNADSFFQSLKNEGIDYYPYDVSFFTFENDIYDLPLCGNEKNFIIQNHVIVTVRENNIVGYSQNGIQESDIKHVYQLLMRLGGGYATLLEHEPENISGSKDIVTYLKWKTNNATFIISSLEWDDPTDWKDNQPFSFCLFENNYQEETEEVKQT